MKIEKQDEPASKAAAKSAVPHREPIVEHERANFRALILANPNYFGTIAKSPLKPVKVMSQNEAYEELKCVGYNPQFERLEAVVHLKRNAGYGGGLCTPGTPEYVRFFLSYDNGATWADQGLTSFTAWDFLGVRPLEYAVTLSIHPDRKFCFNPNLLKVRAILSWNSIPPPGDPNPPIVWGNTLDGRIQVEALLWPKLINVLVEAKLDLPPKLKPLLDPEQPVALTKPKPLTGSELAMLYKGKDVPGHRFMFQELQANIAKPAMMDVKMLPAYGNWYSQLKVDIAGIIAKMLDTNGDTSYEEMTCVGLDPNLDQLEAVINVKKPYGYSGDPCSAGSNEYVGFWIDWGDGAGWTYAGTTSVSTHDFSPMPAGGLDYAVFLPLNLAAKRQPCSKGPKTARVRAILSWQSAPPPGNPDYVPTWGDREETIIHIKPGPSVEPDVHTPFIETVGNMAVSSINNATGLANGPAVGAGFTALDSPFGGEVVITGHIANPPDVLGGGAAPFKYRVWISNDNGVTWQKVTNTFTAWLTQLLGGVWTGPTATPQAVDADDCYTYQEDLTGGPGDPEQFVAENVLARWETLGLTGLWKVKIEAITEDPVTHVKTSWYSNVVTVCLDNAAPVPAITITSGGGPCADFGPGDPITGTYSVTDEHFGTLSIGFEPSLGGGSFTAPVPLPRSYPLVPTAGEAGTWTLDTTGMPKCGYVIRLTVNDRTIVNSGAIGWYNSAVVGLCLRKATTT
jgi:hypothetical protein